MPRRIIPPVERFWSHVRKDDACWVWTAGKHEKGYGLFNIKQGQPIRAHRFSYATFVGPIPAGLFVCHHCDNPSCVRPDHLFVGTNRDNMLDAVRKGRIDLSNLRPFRRGNDATPKSVPDQAGASLLLPRRKNRIGTGERTHCHRGHAYTAENTRIIEIRPGSPSRLCVTCRREHSAKWRAAHRKTVNQKTA